MVKILVAEDDNKKVNNFQWNVEKEKFLRKWILGKVKSYNLADEMKKFVSATDAKINQNYYCPRMRCKALFEKRSKKSRAFCSL